MKPNLATIARYYRLGIEAGLLEADDARAWAMSVIEDDDAPDGAIIEVSWLQSEPALLAALNAVPGEPDLEMVGKWLLADLRTTVPHTVADRQRAVRLAMNIARVTDLDENIYYEFDRIDDTLALAVRGEYGTVSECWLDFEHALQGYLPPPFPSHERRAR